jgi:hypothetical protein
MSNYEVQIIKYDDDSILFYKASYKIGTSIDGNKQTHKEKQNTKQVRLRHLDENNNSLNSVIPTVMRLEKK